ncbi:MAG: cobalamin-binding protein [Acidobacteriota bacterium]|nr:cobalamin-binding protein [Acidobacteriota bacterium]
MRIVSLLPSATEILFALELDTDIVGVSHECDFPPQARERRVLIHSRIPHGLTALEVDTLVRQFMARGESLYSVDGDILRELAPDLVVTQDLCHVCSASPEDLAAVLRDFEKPPKVLCLNPQNLSDVWRDVMLVAQATARVPAAEKLLHGIHERLKALQRQVGKITTRPRVAFLEWLEPFYVGGHWVPEMVALAGGQDAFGKIGTASFRVELKDIVAAAPEIIVVSPCGYDAAQAGREYGAMAHPPEWETIPAVKNGRVYAFEANSYASRPGPRLALGVEGLAKIFHPEIAVSDEAGHAFQVMGRGTESYESGAAGNDLWRPAHIL